MSLITFDLPFNASNLYHNSNGNLNEISGGGGGLTLSDVLANGNTCEGIAIESGNSASLVLYADTIFQASFSELEFTTHQGATVLPAWVVGTNGREMRFFGATLPNGMDVFFSDTTNNIYFDNSAHDILFAINQPAIPGYAFFVNANNSLNVGFEDVVNFSIKTVDVLINGSTGFSGTLAAAASAGKSVVNGLIVN